MKLTKAQIILLGAGLLIILLLALVFAGAIPGLRPDSNSRGLTGKLTIWGVFDDEKTFGATLGAGFLANNPNVELVYKQLNSSTYETELINALAAGVGPDIFMIHNSWLGKHKDKLFPLSSNLLSLSQLRSSFPKIIETDFVSDEKVYALPLYIDTMVMIYNREMFDSVGIANPPKTWSELIRLIPLLRQLDKTGRISRAAAAVGGSDRNIDRAGDLLSLMMLQHGSVMVRNNSAAFASKEGENGVEFYTNFARPSSPSYTWDLSFPNSIDAFTQDQNAIVFNYAYQLPTIELKNPFLDYGVAPMLQINPDKPVNYANYWGLTVSNKSQNPEVAWSFILSSAMDPDISSRYLSATSKPPALRSLIGEQVNRSDSLGVFSKQALTATSWRQIDSVRVDGIFTQMIESILQGRLTINSAIRQAQEKVSTILARYPI